MKTPILVDASPLQQFTSNLFQAGGVALDEAHIVARSLVEANLRGHESHGVVRVPAYLQQLRSGELVAGAKLEILSETASMLTADARFGFGQVQAVRVIERLLPKAREQGLACGTMKNCGHVGRLGEWVERIASEGLAGLVTVNDNGVLQCVAPPGGIEPRISTNPLAIGVPTGTDDPLVIDFSTSAVANGKVKVAHVAGDECPPGWLQDSAGHPTTDPTVRFTDPRGTLLPMGGEAQGYKGFGLGLLLDVLVGGLSGGFCPPAPEDAPGTNNVLIVIWSPEQFAGQAHFLTEAGKLAAYVKSPPFKPGVGAIRLPGERSAALATERRTEGIPLDRGTWQALMGAAEALGVGVPVV